MQTINNGIYGEPIPYNPIKLNELVDENEKVVVFKGTDDNLREAIAKHKNISPSEVTDLEISELKEALKRKEEIESNPIDFDSSIKSTHKVRIQMKMNINKINKIRKTKRKQQKASRKNNR